MLVIIIGDYKKKEWVELLVIITGGKEWIEIVSGKCCDVEVVCIALVNHHINKQLVSFLGPNIINLLEITRYVHLLVGIYD